METSRRQKWHNVETEPVGWELQAVIQSLQFVQFVHCVASMCQHTAVQLRNKQPCNDSHTSGYYKADMQSECHDCHSYQARTENKESIGQNIYCWSLSQRRSFHVFYQQSSFARTVSLLHAALALLWFHVHMSCNVSLQNLCYDVPGYFALPFSLKRFLSTSFSVSGCPWHLANSSGQGDCLSHNQICVHLVNSTAKKRKWQYV